MRQATIKDIAAQCNISATTVSAALRNKKSGTVSYSLQTQQMVLKAASDLGYRPVRLAQAMKSGVIPIVVVSLQINDPLSNTLNLYLQDTLITAATEMHKYGLEMMFLPYDNHEQQLIKLLELYQDKFIGGIITNYIKEEEYKLIAFSSRMQIPLLVLGKLNSGQLISIGISEEKFYKTISEFAKGKNLKRIVEVFLTLPDILAYKPLGQVSEQAVFDFEECADVLFVARGEKSKEVLLNSKKQVKSAQVLVIEDNRIPVYSRPALMVKSMAQIRAIESVKLIADWMKNGIVPAQKSYIIEGREEDYQILT